MHFALTLIGVKGIRLQRVVSPAEALAAQHQGGLSTKRRSDLIAINVSSENRAA
jgi:hypothetical protein